MIPTPVLYPCLSDFVCPACSIYINHETTPQSPSTIHVTSTSQTNHSVCTFQWDTLHLITTSIRDVVFSLKPAQSETGLKIRPGVPEEFAFQQQQQQGQLKANGGVCENGVRSEVKAGGGGEERGRTA
ncbi:hypothetical protein M409DRAFT_57695 [Zasmidium cellare ATCC 36951]|uniref:Uncharacterized protein n=1 Tax=Zasmidium cellare ATCC 36951 TaxID=1080233 RepID=A0A6A6CAS5_ZASCE|nr:uncharacterized protein M409DRAFT_57695 [Zasmidium cellare ATCC 36951]KAF2163012.1 hypothetical protein M409DRAFT_57695 [Zasmidium cellare ATCC 36951]